MGWAWCAEVLAYEVVAVGIDLDLVMACFSVRGINWLESPKLGPLKSIIGASCSSSLTNCRPWM